jgi:hypothetical protein
MTEPVSDIRYLERNDIDTVKWDHCIRHAPNALIYARSFYLDAMAENWSALVAGDYQYVMPLTWKKKMGFKYLYQPYFTKSLGVFGDSRDSFEISSFLLAIPDMFRYWDIDLNENNFVSTDIRRLHQRARRNYFLSLANDYDHISQQYKRLASRMTKKAMEGQLEIIRGESPELIIKMYQRDYANRHKGISGLIYERLSTCTAIAFENNLAETYLAKTPAGETLAYYMILKDDRYIYSLLGGSTKDGKLKGAFYLLTDAIIRDHAGTNKIFRFEGSDIPGVSFFDNLFGPERISYQHLVMNKLPFLIRFFK